jgi:hypothetical protein
MWYVALCVWPHSLSTIFFFYYCCTGVHCDIYKSSYNASYLNSPPPYFWGLSTLKHASIFHPFLWLNNISFYIYITFCSSIDGHLGCFQVLATVNSAIMNIHTQLFIWILVFSSLGHILRSGIAGSCGNCMFNFFLNWVYYFNSESNDTITVLTMPCLAAPLKCS